MSRWILSSIALHLALVFFVYISALLSRPEKEDELFVVDLFAGIEDSEPAPEETPEPAPTPPPEETKAPTKAPTKPPTKAPTKEVTKVPTKEAKKPPKKKVVDTSPRKLPDRLRPTPPPEPDRSERLKKLEELKDDIIQAAKEPVEVPTTKPTRRPTPPPNSRTSSNNTGVAIKTQGMGRLSNNYYFVLMQRQLYKNWDLKPRDPGEAVRKADVTVVVRKDGTIDIDRCLWNNRSRNREFDDSVWAAVKRTELPKFPAEFTMAEIKVAVTFRDEV